MASRFVADLESQFAAAGNYRPNKADWLEGAWSGLEPAPDDDRRGDTAVSLQTLREIGQRLVTVPDGFHLNRNGAIDYTAAVAPLLKRAVTSAPEYPAQ